MPMATRGLRARGVTGPIDLFTAAVGTNGIAFTALAAAPTITEYNTAARRVLNLRHILSWSSSGAFGTGAVATAVMGFQYSIDGGSTWFWLDGSDGSAPAASSAPVMSMASNNTMVASSIIPVPPVARTPATLVRVAATGGNGSANPTIRMVTLVAEEIIL